MNIKTIIFDLGGVIIDLDELATTRAFAKLSGLSSEQVIQDYLQNPIFKQYEKGLISDTDFRAGINQFLNTNLSDHEIDHAWNAMLGDIPGERLELLTELRKSHQVLILSNTNSIHEKAFNQILKQGCGANSMHEFADQVFFSHELHMRKPDTEIYTKVLELASMHAAECLFLDDKKENLTGAASVGINTLHITHPNLTLSVKDHV